MLMDLNKQRAFAFANRANKMFPEKTKVTGGFIALIGVVALIIGGVYKSREMSGEKKLLCRLLPGTPISLDMWLMVSGVLLVVAGFGLFLSKSGNPAIQMIGSVVAGICLVAQLVYLIMGIVMYFQLSNSNMKVCQDEDNGLFSAFWVVWAFAMIACFSGLVALAGSMQSVQYATSTAQERIIKLGDDVGKKIGDTNESFLSGVSTVGNRIGEFGTALFPTRTPPRQSNPPIVTTDISANPPPLSNPPVDIGISKSIT